MKVLAIGCHPDDIEELCAGTLIRYKNEGHEVTICHVANGSKGHVVIPPEELRVIRREEAKKAGALAGIKVITCDIDDLEVYDNKEQRDLVVDVIRSEQPDVIITHNPDDYMSDHVAVSKLVFDASFAASVPSYKTKVDTVCEVTPIYYMDTSAGVGFMPTEYVDISDTIELKLDMVRCHESQIVWLRDHDKIDYPEHVRAHSRFRGLQSGVMYAEAFTPCLAYAKITTKRLLP